MVNVSENIEDWKFQPQHIGKYDVGICINMVHISPIKCTLGLFRNMSKVLFILLACLLLSSQRFIRSVFNLLIIPIPGLLEQQWS